ncbi:MAG: ABC transporter permease [Brachymonas sp.]|nr:ABC transporter permease [Brachymonas sp.]
MWNVLRRLGRLYTSLVFLFILAPLFVSLVFSFNSDQFPSLPLKEFTLDWYRVTFTDPLVLDAFKRSFLVAVPVGVFSTLLGFAAAYTDYRYEFRGKSIFNFLMMLPPTIPPVIMGLAMLSYLTKVNLGGAAYSIFLSHVVTGIPFAMAIIRIRLSQMDNSLEEASWNLTANPRKTFFHVVVPFCSQSLVAAFLITTAVSFDEFAVAWFVSGLDETVPVRVLIFLQGQVSPRINAIGTVVFGTSILLVAAGMLLSGLGKSISSRANQ